MSHHASLGRNNDTSTISDLKIFIKDVHDKNGRKRPLTVKPWATVKDVKDLLCKHLHVAPHLQKIYFGPLLTRATELPNHRTLQDAGIYRSGETLFLKIKGAELAAPSISSLRCKVNDICVSSSLLDLTPKSLQRMVQQARRGLAVGLKPALAPDGSGGSYFLSDARKSRVGVFKPADEEPFAENNPRGYVSSNGEDNLRRGIRPGELCLRECAAFLLDHDAFSSVPMTTLAEARHPALHVNGACWTLAEGGAAVGIHSLKGSMTNICSAGASSTATELPNKVGSFQEYIHAECSMDDMSPSKLSIDEVHKIAILDIRLMNADRNVANILCQRIPEDPDRFRLIPIDHGYSLRSCADVAWFDWCWLDWPQTKEPLSKSAKDYVLNLDVEADARLLKERLGFKNDVLDYFRASCHVLKSGVKAGLSLYEIASEILCRNDASGEIPSKLENLTSMAMELAMSAVHNGRFHHSTASLALQEQLTSPYSFNGQQPKQSLTPFIKSRPVVRSVSSSIFSRTASSLGGESAFTDELSLQTPPPPMAHSSLSDNSSNDGYSTASAPEEYEAEDWAAAVLAVADESMNADFARDRATSESSDSTENSKLSKSPVGFWYVRPGSSTVQHESSDAEDEEFISWTFSETFDGPPASADQGDNRRPSHIIANSRLSMTRLSSCSNLSKILQDEETGFVGFSLDDHESRSNKEDTVPDWPLTSDRPPSSSSNFSSSVAACTPSYPQNKAFVRSMSYSAFSSASNHTSDEPILRKDLNSHMAVRNSLSSNQEEELFRTYFLKFVDLLIVRETERLVHCRHK
ncbi:hypothetical protein ACHAWX_006971 [Stephanocyclus meneghinianus]